MENAIHKFVGRVRVTAHTTLDVPYLWQARRFFPTKGYRDIEVLDQEDDPPDIVVQKPNKNSGLMQDIVTADQERVGQKSYKLILGDPRLGVQETIGVSHQIMAAEVAASKAQALKMAGQLMDAEGARARLEEENKGLKAQVAELEALIAGVTAPAAEASAEPLANGTASKPKSKSKAATSTNV